MSTAHTEIRDLCRRALSGHRRQSIRDTLARLEPLSARRSTARPLWRGRGDAGARTRRRGAAGQARCGLHAQGRDRAAGRPPGLDRPFRPQDRRATSEVPYRFGRTLGLRALARAAGGAAGLGPSAVRPGGSGGGGRGIRRRHGRAAAAPRRLQAAGMGRTGCDRRLVPRPGRAAAFRRRAPVGGAAALWPPLCRDRGPSRFDLCVVLQGLGRARRVDPGRAGGFRRRGAGLAGPPWRHALDRVPVRHQCGRGAEALSAADAGLSGASARAGGGTVGRAGRPRRAGAAPDQRVSALCAGRGEGARRRPSGARAGDGRLAVRPLRRDNAARSDHGRDQYRRCGRGSERREVVGLSAAGRYGPGRYEAARGPAAGADRDDAAAEPVRLPILVPVTGFLSLEGTSQRNGACWR